ncbi:hypothetical protein F2Q70_00043935 [Brassica cretica]|uniref:Uncharacterized protein n=1 Tax=Brassica cretica TaxID=69181 RepID=A0A8S9KFZ3_BRACR|nr:hypothetical protein F2Q70_00043935 [Brassica cretica]
MYKVKRTYICCNSSHVRTDGIAKDFPCLELEQLRERWTAAEDGVEDDAAHTEAAVEAHRTGERIEQGHRTADSKLQGHMPVEAHTEWQ